MHISMFVTIMLVTDMMCVLTILDSVEVVEATYVSAVLIKTGVQNVGICLEGNSDP